MKARTFVLSFICTVLFAISVNAQPVQWSASDSKPLSELGIPFVGDEFFLANYTSATAVVYINGKVTDITVPPFSFRLASFFVAANTRVEARVNVVTDKGTKVQRLKGRRARTRDGRQYGWLFGR